MKKYSLLLILSGCFITNTFSMDEPTRKNNVKALAHYAFNIYTGVVGAIYGAHSIRLLDNLYHGYHSNLMLKTPDKNSSLATRCVLWHHTMLPFTKNVMGGRTVSLTHTSVACFLCVVASVASKVSADSNCQDCRN